MKTQFRKVSAAGIVSLGAVIVAFLLFSPASGQTTEKAPKKLPTIFLIGDSITCAYRAIVADHFAGRAIVVMHPGNGGAAGHTLSMLDGWLGMIDKPDIVHWNNGIHDAGRYPNRTPQSYTVEEYVSNLKGILEKLRKTGAKVIFATTTPLGPSYERGFYPKGRIEEQNAAAVSLMQKEGVPIDDLHAVIAADPKGIYLEDQLHFNLKGYLRLGESVSKTIEAELPQGTPTEEEAMALPSLLILGDGYTLPSYFHLISKALEGRARVLCSPHDLDDSDDAANGLPEYLKIVGKVDVIHWNVGLMDLWHERPGHPQPITLEDYVANLRKIIATLRGTGAKLVFATTTPVSRIYKKAGAFGWKNEEIAEYNAAACALMKQEGVEVDDLYPMIAQDVAANTTEGFLYSPAGSRLCADAIVKCVTPLLFEGSVQH